MTNAVEALYNWLFINGDNFGTLTEYHESFANRRKVLDGSGIFLANEDLRDKYMREMDNRDGEEGEVYRKLEAWKLADDTADGERDIIAGMERLDEVMAAHIFVKQLGKRYYQFRVEQQNGYNNGVCICPTSVLEIGRRMELWKPTYIPPTPTLKSITVAGETHTLANGKWEITCFKCERKGHGVNECEHTKKEDGSDLNSDEEIKRRFDEINKKKEERMNRQNSSNEEGGEQHVMMGEQHMMMQSMLLALEEDKHDGYIHEGWAF